ncbi:uncharacterized protein LOC103850085 [Brassica rapa]|uniref:Uncharacterized protein n=3 Tax=Brassica TaxID=3705 RepID=A0ABQ8BKD8_BRANA|nr:uncharacterized protein LOC103850085 [Brassica rapa]XP_013729698.2 uncharacterized protein LOC106433418 [Brassica napus]KAH0905280.1 hypothetical protein HID58_044783 [Brassica napus]CAF2371511.1 unnamed protein product [Brassica napus]CAF2374264.1 unnamed protein product [Brassica napus]CDY28694.1 BnaCnng05800D [Brassica napus]
MAKISLLLLVVVLFSSLQAYEAHRIGNFDKGLEKDLHNAEAMIEEDLKAKKTSTQGLKSEVTTLSKSEQKLKQLGNDYKKDTDEAPYGKKLKKFSRLVKVKEVLGKKKKAASVIQKILKDFGLNGGRE